MKIVDSHQHLWDLDLFRYSWLNSLPLLNRSFRMRDYLAAANGLNVVKSVHVEADVDEPFMLDETRHLLALADQGDNPSKHCCLQSTRERAFQILSGQDRRSSQGKGIRRVLHTQPDEVGQGVTFIKNVAALSGYAFRSTSVFWLGSFPSRSN